MTARPPKPVRKITGAPTLMQAPRLKNLPRPRRAGARIDPGRPLRLLFKAPSWVGDAIMATPTLRHLRQVYPDAHITVMARPWVAPIFEHNPDLNQLWACDDSGSTMAFLRAVSQVRAGRYAAGVLLQNSFRSALLLALGGVGYRLGYATGGRSLLLSHGVKLEPELLDTHQVYFYLHLAEVMCGKPAGVPRLVLEPGVIEREEVRQLGARLGLDRGRPVVGIAPGSINSDAKRWPAERFAELATRLSQAADADVLLLGSAREQEVLDRVAALARGRVHNLGGKMSLGQLIALLERLDGLICNDSGAMHMAAALNVPTVAIFGPTDFTTTYPFSFSATFVRKDVECSPCMLRQCPIDHRCMTEISVEEIADSFRQMIKNARIKKEKMKATAGAGTIKV